MKLKWEQKAFGIGLVALIAILYVNAAFTRHTESVAADERAAARVVAAKAAVIRDAEAFKALSAKFATERESMMTEMQLALSSKSYYSSIKFGNDFKGVADPEFLQRWQQVVDADQKETDVAKAQVAKQKAKSDERTNRALTFARMIRTGAHDPTSVEFTTVFLVNDSQAICYEYRGRNGFNALRKANALISNKGEIKTESSAGFGATWNRECASKRGEDISAAANMYK